MKAIYNENLSVALLFFLRESHVISLTGAGGKTSLLIKLGDLFSERGEKTLLTTTTHLASDISYGNADLFVEKESTMKYKSPDISLIKAKTKEYDRMIIEADGARRLPLKFHTSRDPVVIEETDTVMSLIGISALGKPLDSVLFGIDEYRNETKQTDEVCTLMTIKSLIEAKGGALKGTDGKKTFVVINQADTLTPEEITDVNTLMYTLSQNYLLISLQNNKLYSGVVF